MVIAWVKPIPINCAKFLNPFATNAVKTTQIHSGWYEEIARLDPACRHCDPPCADISVVNELSQRLFSSLTLCIRLDQRVLIPMKQWYSAARPQLTLSIDFEHSRLQISRELYPGYSPRTCLHAPQSFIS
jgi:hypothetical protein